MSIVTLILTAFRDTITQLSLTVLQLPIYIRHPSLIILDCLSFFHYFFHRSDYFKKHQELTYGELSYYSFRKLIRVISPKKNSHFVDFGSGKGKLCFYGTLLGLHCQGIEINEGFYRFSMSRLPWLFKNNISFKHEDFKDVSLENTDILLISPLCLSKDTLTNLSKKKMPSNLHILSIAEPYPGLSITKRMACITSWGITVCYYHSLSQINEFRS